MFSDNKDDYATMTPEEKRIINLIA